MSLAIVHSRAQVGVEAPAVTVEAHLANGLPALTLVGLPEGTVKESKDRVRSTILNSGLDFPARRIKCSQEENSKNEQSAGMAIYDYRLLGLELHPNNCLRDHCRHGTGNWKFLLNG
jgi:hypothetical protein